jgi:D-3-phosphoglycerate dehydrogenase / 2-oxoglutarate reductase
MRVLVVGDSFMPVEVFERGLGPLAHAHEIGYLQLDEANTPQGLDLREYAGDPAEISERMQGIDVLVVHGGAVTEQVLDSSDVLKLVCCARGGPVNVDVVAASERGILVTGTPGKNAEAVADQTLAFIIMLARRFPNAQRFLLEGNRAGASAFEGAQFLGHDLAGHSLGLVGYGNVGQRVAKRARAFDMEILVYDPFLEAGDEPELEQLSELEMLLGRSDFVSLHARATRDNDNLFDSSAFAAMRSGACFVNTARETLVDEEALEHALASGHLGGAALDVVRARTVGGVHPLLRHDNVVITPHIGGATHETLLRGATMVGAEIERFAAGDSLANVVNAEAARL